MAAFTIVLDTRKKLKNDRFNLAVRMGKQNDVMYINITPMTEKQYEMVFIKKSMDTKSIEFRDSANQFLSKCERVFAQMKYFDKKRYRQLLKEKEEVKPVTLLMKDLFDYYIKKNPQLKLKTKIHYRNSGKAIENFKEGITFWEIAPEFLRKFEKNKLDSGVKLSTIYSYMRDIRRVLNYSIQNNLIPADYDYPFAHGKYNVKSYFPRKHVLFNEEIQKVIDFKDFDNQRQEYARNVWLLLYRCNGINFADLLRMRWSNIQGNVIIFFRMKTETTRKNAIDEIVVPINSKLSELINKIGVKESPFILGKLSDGYLDTSFENKKTKVSKKINKLLNEISIKLNLSVPLKLKTARDSYATTLKRAGISKDVIGEMLGHSNSIVTEHYLATLDVERVFEVNEVLL